MIIVYEKNKTPVVSIGTYEKSGRIEDLIDILIELQNKYPDKELYYETI